MYTSAPRAPKKPIKIKPDKLKSVLVSLLPDKTLAHKPSGGKLKPLKTKKKA